MADIEKKIKEIDDAIRIAENPLNTAPGGEIAGRGYVIDRLNEYKELLKAEQPKWIPVEERLPEEDEDVLVCINGTYRDMAYRDEGVWYDEEHNHLKNITHWMPLPKPPKEGASNG